MGHNQEQQFKSKEREIPVFTVLKNNSILKNIYLLDNPPSISPSSSILKNGDQDPETEETLVVGRHPDCSIKLEHPSISRFHLRITLKPYSRCLFVTDLSSVHGTWVSGKRIEAGVLMKLNDGETLQLGGSSRLYKLNWIPLSRAYDIDNTFVPQLDDADAEDDTEGETFHDENILSCESDQAQISSDNIKVLELLSSDENPTFSPKKKMSNSVFNNQKMETKEIYIQEHEISSIQPIEFDKEHDSSGVLSPSEESQTHSEIKNPKTPGTKSEKKSSGSIWRRRGKSKSVHIEAGSHIEESSAGTSNSSHVKSLVDENCHPESVLNDTFVVPGYEEQEIFTPDKENHSPFSLVVGSCKGKAVKNCLSILKTHPLPSNSSHVKSLIYEKYCSQPVSKDDSTFHDHEDKEIFTPEKENHSPFSPVVGSWMSIGEKNHEPVLKFPTSSLDQDEDIFNPDKENISANARCLRLTKKMEILEVKNPTSSHRSSPLSKSVNCNLYQEVNNRSTPDIGSQPREVLPTHKLKSFESKSRVNLKKKLSLLKSRDDRHPLKPLFLKSFCNSSGNSKPSTHEATTTRGGGCTNKFEEAFLLPFNISRPNLQKKSTVEQKKRWTIIVDTASLLNKNSRKELQLLRGLKGTHLIIPRIVLRELDCMLRCGSFFRRTEKVSAALQWIEDCMENTEWWIHVQSSVEEGKLIPPTPPPASSPHWYNEERNAVVSIGPIPFSPYSFREIVSPTTKDHILESALFFRRIKNNEKLVLLSDDVTLKIKAMAEGVICETAEEFRRSLVNPFSERFLYTESSPRGPTWSLVDDAILKERYYPSPSKKLSKSGGDVKGLKLILLHSSNVSIPVPVL